MLDSVAMPFQLRRLFAFVLPILAACSSSSPTDPAGASAGAGGSGPVCSGGSGGGAPVGSGPHTSVDLAGACQNLFDQQAAYSDACVIHPPTGLDAAAFVTLCLGVATAPGSLLTTADVDACANEVGALKCLGKGQYPSCIGGHALLFPAGDKAGAFPAGVSCFAGFQCASGHCALTDGLCGTCRRGRTSGETCSTPGDVCLGSTCTQGICRETGSPAGTSCFEYGGTSGCQQGLFCLSAQGVGLCVPLAEECGSCKDGFRCAQGLTCDGSQCVPFLPNGASCASGSQQCSSECLDGVCRRRKLAQNEGEPCVYDTCAEGLRCDGAVCTSQGVLAKGDVCWLKNAPTGLCGPGLACENFCGDKPCKSGSCVDLPAPGEPCVAIGECGPGAFCRGFNTSPPKKGVCVKLGGEDEACPCAGDLVCSRGLCKRFTAAACP